MPRADKQILYAAMSALGLRALEEKDPITAVTNALRWVISNGKQDFTTVFCADILQATKFKPYLPQFITSTMDCPQIKEATAMLAQQFRG
jgi:hypothetical protein